MLNTDACFLECINSPVRNVRARVELLAGSTLLNTFKYTDRLREFTIERVGEGKFFGYGICHRLNVKLIDKDRELDISTANSMEIAFGTGRHYIYPYPIFHVSEVNRDEKTNELSITAYDAIYKASNYTVADLDLPTQYSIAQLATACASVLGVPVGTMDEAFDTLYENGSNFDGKENIREVLNAIAEATQTIYYLDHDWVLTFKRLDISGDALLTIDKSKYFDLDSSTNRKLVGICHTTDLGDNVSAELAESGTTQYIRNNPFWDLRDDIGTLISNALTRIGGLTINQFDCKWRGNYLLEIGDKIALITKDNKTVYSYLLNDSIYYDGSLEEKTQWSYDSDDAENESNSVSVGTELKRTYARVDKANKQIEIMTSDVQENKENISNLQLTTDNITASVKKVEEDASDSYSNLSDSINKLSSEVEAKMSAEDVKLEITSTLENGVDKVITSTGFTFNEEGLNISKTGSEMTTQITEDGMQVFRDNTAVLTANNVGVDAINLHATTYLIIGTNSRFEDYGDNRTGCFWIGE